MSKSQFSGHISSCVRATDFGGPPFDGKFDFESNGEAEQGCRSSPSTRATSPTSVHVHCFSSLELRRFCFSFFSKPRTAQICRYPPNISMLQKTNIARRAEPKVELPFCSNGRMVERPGTVDSFFCVWSSFFMNRYIPSCLPSGINEVEEITGRLELRS